MLDVQTDAGVATLTLARPGRGNALAADLVEALLAAVDAACADPAVHTLRLRAEGPHFCTGLDLSTLADSSDGELLWRLVRIETLLQRLWHAPIRTLVHAQGRCWGAGADLFAVCDERVADESTTFRFPGAQFGIVLGTRRLAERVGTQAARRIVTEGGEWTAAQALQAGLVSRLGAPSAGELPAPRADRGTVQALRDATRTDHRDADLAALVRSASPPGLRARIEAYRERLRTAR